MNWSKWRFVLLMQTYKHIFLQIMLTGQPADKDKKAKLRPAQPWFFKAFSYNSPCVDRDVCKGALTVRSDMKGMTEPRPLRLWMLYKKKKKTSSGKVLCLEKWEPNDNPLHIPCDRLSQKMKYLFFYADMQLFSSLWNKSYLFFWKHCVCCIRF